MLQAKMLHMHSFINIVSKIKYDLSNTDHINSMADIPNQTLFNKEYMNIKEVFRKQIYHDYFVSQILKQIELEVYELITCRRKKASHCIVYILSYQNWQVIQLSQVDLFF